MIPPSKWQNAQREAINSKTPEPLQDHKEDVTTYNDEGVNYKGYARKQTGTNTYTKIPQTRIVEYATINSTTNPQTLTNVAEKKFYLKSVLIAGLNRTALGLTTTSRITLGIQDGIGGTYHEVITIPYAKDGTSLNEKFEKEIYFNIPIEFRGKESISMVSVKDHNGGNHFIVTVTGWIE